MVYLSVKQAKRTELNVKRKEWLNKLRNFRVQLTNGEALECMHVLRSFYKSNIPSHNCSVVVASRKLYFEFRRKGFDIKNDTVLL